MKSAAVKLTYGRTVYPGAFEKDNYFLCADILRELFNIPVGIKKIVFKVSTDPMPESYKFINNPNGFGGTIIYTSMVKGHINMNGVTKNFLLEKIGNPAECYFSVEY